MEACKSIKLQHVPKKINARRLPSLHELSSHDQAYTRGYREGWEKAQADCKLEMEKRIAASRARWDAAVHSLNSLPGNIIKKLRDQLVSLAFNAVRKILLATPVTKEEVMAQVKEVLDHAESGVEITVQLHPEDLELLTAEDRGALWNENLTHLKWTSDPSIPRGGCILQGEFGWIDERRETRLKKLEQTTVQSIQKPSV